MKGTAIFQLLTILREETDDQHRLSQQALSDRMLARYGVKLNRRTLKAYLDDLIEAGFPLNTSKRQRILPDGSEETLQTDWYLEPQFEISELRLLCDLLNGMPAVPAVQRDSLTEKLIRFAPPSFPRTQMQQPITYLHTLPAQQMMFSVELLCEAMRRNCMVSFQYGSYALNADGTPELKPRVREDGAVREYLVSPYEIVVSHGRYYLICCKEPYRSCSNYRIDRMMEMQIHEDFTRLPLEELESKTAYPQQLAEQLYMYSGNTEEVCFLADSCILSDVLDWFGSEIRIEPAMRPNLLRITVQVHPTAMQHWALQYGKYVTVLSPESLRMELAEIAANLSKRYKEEVPE